ncbi:MAG: 2Fe-2S iron-sulfur cluster binding domain-containing protein [Treponema sp.]|jgi:aerobic carbon-monoxide dehydrogenase small subunit|nr:2Fe-2S iron-sulfur cluster binding domain-containing protein [Treponema sp.]
MKINITLNGTKQVFDAMPDEPLINVLRRNSCIKVKNGCGKGYCGSCTILLNDRPVASCKIPFALAKDTDIVTLDYFERTQEYSDIMKGFKKAGIQLCGYCDAGKIFSTYQILKNPNIPKRKEITEALQHLAPCCVDLETLVNGVIYTITLRKQQIERITDSH